MNGHRQDPALPGKSHSQVESTLPSMIQQGRELEQIYLLRGPLLIAVAVFPVAVSMARSLSLRTFLQLTLLGVGVMLLGCDATRIGRDRLRAFLRPRLASLVWDDVLHRLWHPDVEWWRVLVDTLVGQASWMYLLPCTSAQRVQLVQAALRVDREAAERILFAPGGYQNRVLPRALIRWLEQKDADPAGNMTRLEIQEIPIGIRDRAASHDAATASSSSFQSEKESLSETMVVIEDRGEIKDTETHTEGSHRRQQNQAPPALPSIFDTLQSIVLETVSNQLQGVLARLPESKHLAGIGITAAAALALQLRYSSRSRRIALGVVETSTMAGLTAISMGASTLFLAKTFGPEGTFPIHESTMISYISKVFQLRKSLKGSATMAVADEGGKKSNDAYRRGFACVALALVLLGLRKRQQLRRQPAARR